jgi:hypothetical protein
MLPPIRALQQITAKSREASSIPDCFFYYQRLCIVSATNVHIPNRD